MAGSRNDPQRRRQSRHDPYAKFSLKHKQTAIGFLRQHLPKKLLARLDLTRLRIEGEHLVGRLLSGYLADIVIAVPLRDQEEECVYILTEHLRQSEYLLPFRMIAMVFQFIQSWLRQHHGQRRFRQTVSLPLVLPLVFYNGKVPYSGPLRLLDVFVDPKSIERILNQPLCIVDTHRLVLNESDDDPFSYVFQTVMKYISSPRLKDILLDLKPKLERMSREPEGMASIHAMIRYLLTSADHMEPEAIRNWAQSLDLGGRNMKALLRFYREEFGPEMDDLVAKIKKLKQEKKELAAAAERKAAEAERKAAEAKQQAAEVKRQAAAAERKAAEAKQQAAEAMLREGLDLDLVARVLNTSREWVRSLAHTDQPADDPSS